MTLLVNIATTPYLENDETDEAINPIEKASKEQTSKSNDSNGLNEVVAQETGNNDACPLGHLTTKLEKIDDSVHKYNKVYIVRRYIPSIYGYPPLL